jgi:hypothetical protein
MPMPGSPLVAAKTAMWCGIMFVVHAAFLPYIDITWNLEESEFKINPSLFAGIWFMWRIIP